MNKITFEQYKSAIKVKYEEKKSEDVSGILLNPTPAQLRNLCLMIFDNLLSKSDENIFRLFFNVKEEERLRKSMERSDIARFRPIISFLKGEKDSENSTRIELAAILIDFNPRPYSKYLLNVKINEIGDVEVPSLMEKDKAGEEDLPLDKWVEKGFEPKNIGKFEKRKVVILTVFLSLFYGVYCKEYNFPRKRMYDVGWQSL